MAGFAGLERHGIISGGPGRAASGLHACPGMAGKRRDDVTRPRRARWLAAVPVALLALLALDPVVMSPPAHADSNCLQYCSASRGQCYRKTQNRTGCDAQYQRCLARCVQSRRPSAQPPKQATPPPARPPVTAGKREPTPPPPASATSTVPAVKQLPRRAPSSPPAAGTPQPPPAAPQAPTPPATPPR